MDDPAGRRVRRFAGNLGARQHAAFVVRDLAPAIGLTERADLAGEPEPVEHADGVRPQPESGADFLELGGPFEDLEPDADL